MFGFLKDKLKGALGKLTKEVEKESIVEKKETIVEKKVEDKKPEQKERIEPKKVPESRTVEVQKVEEPKKKGFFQRIFGKRDEEEDIIEEKEELRARAERIIIEPEMKKEAPKTRIEEKVPVKAPRQDLKPVEKKVEERKPETKKVEVKVEDVQKEERLIIPEVEQIIHKEEPIIHKTEQTHKPSPVIAKIEKPHHLIVEEERASKTIEAKEEEPKGFFSKITETFTKIQITEEKFEELFWELEVVLLENNVALEVIDKIKRDLKKELMTGKVSRKAVDELIISTLKQSITELFDVEKIDLVERIKDKREKSNQPYIITIIGVNGSGKTTSIAKLTYKLQKEGLQVVLAASDTFRAAAIQQLEEHANNLNVKMVKHDYYSDPAAVGFDAIKYAEAKGADVVIIDTAGRLHSNTNLMRELEKVIRVCRPDIKIFVGESITGNDCVEQAKEFDKAVGIDAIILAKADVDDKGGAAISVSYILQRPILYLGTGQNYEDLKEFDSKVILDSLEL